MHFIQLVSFIVLFCVVEFNLQWTTGLNMSHTHVKCFVFVYIVCYVLGISSIFWTLSAYERENDVKCMGIEKRAAKTSE